MVHRHAYWYFHFLAHVVYGRPRFSLPAPGQKDTFFVLATFFDGRDSDAVHPHSSGNVAIGVGYCGRASRAIVDFFWNEVCCVLSRGMCPVLVSAPEFLIHILRDGHYLAVAG